MSSKVLVPPARVLVTKIGLDGHDRGSRIVAAYFRDAGMEVIYTPPWQSIDAVVNLVIQEDIELIGLSTLATDHLIIPELMDALRARSIDNITVVVGGIVPNEEHAELIHSGVKQIFGPGSSRDDIIDGVRSHIMETRAARML